MARVKVTAIVAGPVTDVEALWHDVARWPAFVDGFGGIVRADAGWPAPGTGVVWNSGPHGPGRTRERSVSPGVREVETEQLTGTLSAAYVDGHLEVSLDYQLKQRTVYTLFFVRRSLRDSLWRTVERYAVERRADAEFAG